MVKNFTLLILVMFTVSCSFSGGQIPADHYYRLPEALVEKLNTPKFEHLLLNPVKVEGLYHERSILYVEQATPLEVKRYHYHYWVETPARLVGKYAQTYLSHSGVTRELSLNASSDPADVETNITIKNFERIVNLQGAQILISLQIAVKYKDNLKSGFSKNYVMKVAAESNSMYASVEAFGLALNQIMASFLNDLSNKSK